MLPPARSVPRSHVIVACPAHVPCWGVTLVAVSLLGRLMTSDVPVPPTFAPAETVNVYEIASPTTTCDREADAVSLKLFVRHPWRAMKESPTTWISDEPLPARALSSLPSGSGSDVAQSVPFQ